MTGEQLTVIISLLITAVVAPSVSALLAYLLVQEKQKLAEVASRKKAFEEIAEEALESNLFLAEKHLSKEGKGPVPIIAPVVSEGHSPSTPEQREVARMNTARAMMAAIKKATGQQPRPEPPRGNGWKE